MFIAISRTILFIAALSLTVGCGAENTVSHANAQSQEKRSGDPEHKEFPKLGKAFGHVCFGQFKFDDVTDTHWEYDQVVRLIGPLTGSGDMLILVHPSPPSPPNLVKPGLYTAYSVSATTPPDAYYLTVKVQGDPPHAAETDHPTVITIDEFDDDDCPEYATFWSEYDPGDDGDDHGGHAGSGRF